MTKKQADIVADKLTEIVGKIAEVLPEAIAISMLLDSKQRGAILAGLAAATQGLDKAAMGVLGEYEGKKRTPKPTEE